MTLSDALKNSDTLLFDFDGTLVDSLSHFYQLYLDFLKEFDIEGSREEFDHLNGASIKEVVGVFQEKYKITEDAFELLNLYFQKVELAYNYQVQPFPGVFSFLKEARMLGYRFAIVSSAPRRFIEQFLSAHKVLDWFDEIITLELEENGKPAPDIFFKAIEVMDLKKEGVLVFEDSENGVAAAEAAGLSVCKMFSKSHEIFAESWKEVQSALPDVRTVRLKGSVKIVEVKRAPVSEGYRPIWEEMKQGEPDRFHDGRVFAIESFKASEIRGSWIDYGYFAVAQSKKVSLPAVWTAAVMGICHCEGKVLFAKRSKTTFQYPGCWEFAPSGALSCVDPAEQLVIELSEELGIQKDAILSLLPAAALIHRNDTLIDLWFKIELTPGVNIQLSNEYDAFEWVSTDEVVQFLQKEPTVPNLLEIYS